MRTPKWALKKAAENERLLAIQAIQNGRGMLRILDRKKLKTWMKQHNWHTSWLSLAMTFRKQLFSSDANFALALQEEIAEIWIPKASFVVPQEDVEAYDKDYKDGAFDLMVSGLREYRRATEAGVILEIDGAQLQSVRNFFDWVHQRYPLLEEGVDRWIGNDD